MARSSGGPERVRGRGGMILPDVNVLVHAHNADSGVHERARQWWMPALPAPKASASLGRLCLVLSAWY
jgi:hypothetical protein